MQGVSGVSNGTAAVPDHAVVIAGRRSPGVMLAAELALAKVDVAVVERRPDHVLAGSRAGGFHSRTIEVLDQRGVADRFLAEGRTVQALTFGTTTLDMSDFSERGIPTRWRSGRTRSSGSWPPGSPSCRCGIYHGCEVTGFAQDDTGVDVERSRRPRRCGRSTSSAATADAASLRKSGRHRVPGVGAVPPAA